MFLTWKLWKALRHPPRQQVIYRYVSKFSSKQTGLSIPVRVVLALFILSILTIGLLNPSILFGLILGIIALIPILLLVFNSTIQGLYWLMDASKQIRNIHGANQFDLIQLTPLGRLGIVWLVAVSCVNSGNSFQRINRVIQVVVLIILGLIGGFVALIIWNYLTATNSFQQDVSFETLRILISVGFFVGGMGLDYVQSIITSLLLSILAPTYTRDNFFLSSLLPIVYLLLQVSIYLVTVIIFIVFQTIFTGLFGASLLGIFGISTITLLSFYFTRETIISLMWQVIQSQYDARFNVLLENVS